MNLWRRLNMYGETSITQGFLQFGLGQGDSFLKLGQVNEVNG